MDDLDRLLEPVFGLLSLGMNQEAWEELDDLAPQFRTSADVIALRINILQNLEKWQDARILAESITMRIPEDPNWWVLWSDSVRNETSVVDARAVLNKAREHHPDSAIIHYSLACYACAQGDTEFAGQMLKHAITIDPELKKHAIDEPDLELIFGKNFPEDPPTNDPPPEPESEQP